MPKGKAGAKPPVPVHKFVSHWTKAKSVAQAAKWAGTTPKAAAIRAGHLRKKGVQLKTFEVPKAAEKEKVWTVASLNTLIKEITGGEAPTPGKKLGRPKGSKNKKTKEAAGAPTGPEKKLTLAEVLAEEDDAPATPEPDMTEEELVAFREKFPPTAQAAH